MFQKNKTKKEPVPVKKSVCEMSVKELDAQIENERWLRLRNKTSQKIMHTPVGASA